MKQKAVLEDLGSRTNPGRAMRYAKRAARTGSHCGIGLQALAQERYLGLT